MVFDGWHTELEREPVENCSAAPIDGWLFLKKKPGVETTPG